MKYLDENIEYTVTGLAVPSAGTYYYKVYQDGDVIFYGNTFLNSGDTEKTFNITDIVANQKWKGTLVTPLSERTEKVNVIQRYKVGLLINGGEESGQYIDVALVYRYPNRKNALEATILDMNSIDTEVFQNCLQGAKNGVCECLPHIPYKHTSNYAFGVVAEYGYYDSFNFSKEYKFDLEGQLYTNSGVTASWSGATTQNMRTMDTLYASANTSYTYPTNVQIAVATASFNRPNQYYSLTDVYTASTNSLAEQPTAIKVFTGANGTTQLARFNFVNGRLHGSLDAVPTSARFFLKHNVGADNTNYIRFGTTSWNSISYPIHIEFDAELTASKVIISNVRFSRGCAYNNETYLNVNVMQYQRSVVLYADQQGATYEECVEFLMTLGYTNAEADSIMRDIGHGYEVTVFTGTPDEANEVYTHASGFFDAGVESADPILKPQHVAIVDLGCLPKYYLLWQDRYGGYQSQAFDKVDTFSIDYGYEEMKNYQNARRNISVDVNSKWKIQTDWLDEDVYPIYESIFVSPYLVLYDTEEDKSYNVMLNDKKYTEKNWENQHKFFNLQLNLELNKAQHIIY